ncbi:hypothetical protein AJ88_12555 [Mesorhizobium amorphae CCBAU 01583]|nr:hypothetical protein AJ88_12555 [Mesorhizobium amorphae CCBAU 01583]
MLKTSGAALGLVSASFPIGRAFAATATVGFIYVGPKDDYGYNQAHAEGAAALKGVEGISIVEEENVPETVDVQKTMESMINLDGASLTSRPPSAISIPTCWPCARNSPTSSSAIAAACGTRTSIR